MARIVFYGRLADKMGRERTIALGPDGQSVQGLIELLSGGDQELRRSLSDPSVKFAVNDTVGPRDARIGDDDEIAVMPPFSGG